MGRDGLRGGLHARGVQREVAALEHVPAVAAVAVALEAAAATAVPATALTAALIQASESGIGNSTSTTYFINGRRAPIGASSPESRDAVLARRTWSKIQADKPILEQLARKHLPAVVRERLGGADIGFV